MTATAPTESTALAAATRRALLLIANSQELFKAPMPVEVVAQSERISVSHDTALNHDEARSVMFRVALASRTVAAVIAAAIGMIVRVGGDQALAQGRSGQTVGACARRALANGFANGFRRLSREKTHD